MTSKSGPGPRPSLGRSLLRRKTIDATMAATAEEGFKLRRSLGGFDLAVVGIGVIIGAGIFVLTGQAAATEAGPGVTVSFALAAFACALAALCYAELASMVPAAGSAYMFSFASFGELVAFIIGWDLMLELTIGAGAVAIGWSGYLNATLEQIFSFQLPDAITAPPGSGGVVNLTGLALLAVLVPVLIAGARITARATGLLVGLTILVLALVIAFGAPHIDTSNWIPYFPFGAEGVIGGAALVFFAFIGFDIVATMSEETRKPARDLPIGILGSLAVVTLLYVVVSAVITGMLPYTRLDTPAPIADAFETLNKPWLSSVIFLGALIALTKTTMIDMLGQTRVAFAMARDRLLPPGLARTHPRFGTPHRITAVTGLVVALIAGFLPFRDVTEMVNIGTLFAFALVAGGVLVLRRIEPDRPRPFRTPFVWIVGPASIVLSIVLMVQLQPLTWLRFVVWMAIGLTVYFLYSRKRSVVANQ
jgi:APA family basic amino acid/polyamine antiporter